LIIGIVVLVFRAWRLIRIVHGVFEGVNERKEKEAVRIAQDLFAMAFPLIPPLVQLLLKGQLSAAKVKFHSMQRKLARSRRRVEDMRILISQQTTHILDLMNDVRGSLLFMLYLSLFECFSLGKRSSWAARTLTYRLSAS